MIEELKDQLAKGFVQRAIYGLGLVLWTSLLWERIINISYSTSFFGLSGPGVYLIPAMILALQMVMNNRLLWGLIFGLVTIYIIVSLYSVLADVIERSGDHVKAIDWEIQDVVFLFSSFGLIICVDVLLYSIKPKRII